MASLRPDVASSRAAILRARYEQVRGATAALAAPLSAEDQLVQSMPDASPAKWHLAHTTWFFETFVLAALVPGYAPFDARYALPLQLVLRGGGRRGSRGRSAALLTRPSVEEVRAYRRRDRRRGWPPSSTATREVGDAARPRRARAAPRAAAPGADPHRHQARSVDEPAAPGLRCRPGSSSGTSRAAGALGRSRPAASSRSATTGDGLRLRQRGAAPPRATSRPFALAAAGDRRRVPGVHRRRRLRRPELWLSDGWAAVRRTAGRRRSTGRSATAPGPMFTPARHAGPSISRPRCAT